MLIACAGAEPARPGFVEGRISIGPLTPVQRVDESPAKISRETYAAFGVTVFTAGAARKEVAQLTPNEQGDYHLALPPGNYVLDLQHRRRIGGAKDLPRTITIVSDQTVRVDIDIDTGIR